MRALSIYFAVAVLVLLHTLVFFAGFFSPYDYAEQNRNLPYAPPSRVRWDANGRSFFFYSWHATATGGYQEDQGEKVPIRFFVHGRPYAAYGGLIKSWTSDLHLIGTDPDKRFFLLGSDAYGRDQLTRILFGGRISLAAGLLAASISLTLGALLGAIAGLGGWIDEALMRAAEIFMAVPALYLLFAARALMPLRTDPQQLFVVLVTIIGITGWARPARLIRGLVLSVKERDYVTAARGFGATELYLFRRHILPHLSGVVLTQFAVLVPQYVLAEVTLSFVGLGVNEPVPSWGNMLTPLQQYAVLDSYWWMFAPALAAIPLALAYYVLSLAYGQEESRF